MIVDDDREIAKIVEIYFKNEGFTSTKAYNANEAISLLNKNKFQLVILDIMLPDMGGYTLCSK
ncbi:MAG: response regulator, partial [Clostridiales bacterium]